MNDHLRSRTQWAGVLVLQFSGGGVEEFQQVEQQQGSAACFNLQLGRQRQRRNHPWVDLDYHRAVVGEDEVNAEHAAVVVGIEVCSQRADTAVDFIDMSCQ